NGWHWLILDPTPSGTATQSRSRSALAFFGADEIDFSFLWRSFVLDLTAERQARSQRALLSRLSSWSTWLVAGCFVGGAMALRRLRPSWRQAARRRPHPGLANGHWREQDVGWYQSLIQLLLQRLELQPAPGQTPREFSEIARAQLEGR